MANMDADDKVPEIHDAFAGTSAQTDDDVSLLDLMVSLAKRKRLVIGITGSFAVAAIVVAFLRPVQYTAEATILPPQKSNTPLSVAANLNSISSMGMMPKNQNDMYVAIIQSRTPEDAMIKRFHLMERYKATVPDDARKAFEEHRSAKSGVKDNLISISVIDKDPKMAAEMANAYVEEFQKFSATMAITEASQRRVFLQQQVDQAKEKLAESELALKAMEQKSGVVQIDAQERALINSASALRAEVAAKEVEIQGIRSYATEQNAGLAIPEQELTELQSQLAQLTNGGHQPAQEIVASKGQVIENSFEYESKYRDVKYYEDILDLLSSQLESAKLDEAQRGPAIQVVDRAVVPDRRSSPQRMLIIVMATAAGFFLSFVLVVLLEAARSADPEEQERLRQLSDYLWSRRRAQAGATKTT